MSRLSWFKVLLIRFFPPLAEVLGRKLEFDEIKLTNEVWLERVWGRVEGRVLVVTYQLKNSHDFFISFSSAMRVLAVPESRYVQVLASLNDFTRFRVAFQSTGASALTPDDYYSPRVFNVAYWVVD